MAPLIAPHTPAQSLPPPLRLLSGLLADSIAMARSGCATPADIDTAMRLGAGYPAGPFAVLTTLDAAQRALFAAGVKSEGADHATKLPSPIYGRGVGGEGAGSGDLDALITAAAAVVAADESAAGLDGVVGVAGSGTMACGIVEALVRAGRPVRVLCRSEASAARLSARIAERFARLVERGKITAAAAEAAQQLIVTTCDIDDLAPCRFVIEAVKEELAVKRELFAALHARLPVAVALATNTSSFRVSDMADAAPGRCVFAMHFFNPAGVMKLVELVFTEATPADFRAEAAGFVRAIDKVPVVCADTRGFVVNRLLIPFLNDAVRAHEQGIPAAEIDRLATEELQHPMGPLALIDMIGLDVTVFALEAMAATEGGGRIEPAPRLRELVAAGRLGRKSGRGFHDYEEQR